MMGLRNLNGSRGWIRTSTVTVNSRVDYYYPTLELNSFAS